MKGGGESWEEETMSTKAFVFVNADPKRTRQAFAKLPTPTFTVTGRFDAATVVETETPKTLAETVINQIRSQDGVTSTETYPILTEVTKPGLQNTPVKAFVLVRTEPRKTEQVFGSIAGLPETTHTAAVSGRYDVIAKIGTSSWENFSSTVLNKIRTIDGVKSTETILIAE